MREPVCWFSEINRNLSDWFIQQSGDILLFVPMCCAEHHHSILKETENKTRRWEQCLHIAISLSLPHLHIEPHLNPKMQFSPLLFYQSWSLYVYLDMYVCSSWHYIGDGNKLPKSHISQVLSLWNTLQFIFAHSCAASHFLFDENLSLPEICFPAHLPTATRWNS